MRICNLLTLVSDDFQRGLNTIPDNGGLGGSNGASFFGFTMSKAFCAILGKIVSLINIVLLIMIIWSVTYAIFSLIGNSGKWRKRGTVMAISAFCMLLSMHLLIIAGCAYGQLGNGKLVMFLLIALGQLVFYVGAPMLFMLGSHWLQMAEMTQIPQFTRQSQRAYNSIFALIIFGAVIYLVAEVM